MNSAKQPPHGYQKIFPFTVCGLLSVKIWTILNKSIKHEIFYLILNETFSFENTNRKSCHLNSCSFSANIEKLRAEVMQCDRWPDTNHKQLRNAIYKAHFFKLITLINKQILRITWFKIKLVRANKSLTHSITAIIVHYSP